MLKKYDKERVAELIIELLAKEGACMLDVQPIFDYIESAIYRRVGIVPINQATTSDQDSAQ